MKNLIFPFIATSLVVSAFLKKLGSNNNPVSTKMLKKETNLTMKTVLFSMLIAFFALTGCDKEEDDEPSNTDLLTKEWNLLSIDGETASDGYDSFAITFETNGNLIIKATESGITFSQNAKWSWGTNETTINVVIFDEQQIWKLNKLTADALWFYDEDESLLKLEAKK